MIRIWVLIATVVISQYAVAGCIEIKGRHYCGTGECVELNGVAYCASDVNGKVFVKDGIAYCGAGDCLYNDGNVFCSQYSGGGIIKYDHTLWTGPGECIIHDHNVRCAKQPRGKCFIEDGVAKCEGGWVVEFPDPAGQCPVGLSLP